MLTDEKVLETLREIVDPELGVNIVELGFVKEISVQQDRIHIQIVLTVPGCPLANYLLSSVQLAVERIAEGKKVEVELLEEPWTPPWEPSNEQNVSRAPSVGESLASKEEEQSPKLSGGSLRKTF